MSLATIPTTASANEILSLKQALLDFRGVLTQAEQARLDNLIQSNAAPTAASVLDLTNEIDQTNAGRVSRRISARLQPFLDGIQQFTAIVDGFIGLGPSIAETIWGIVKVALLLSSNASSYFEKLTEILKSVGDQCPRYQDYAALFRDSHRLQSALCVYFRHVIHLCQQAVQISRKNAALRLVRTALWPFESHFGPIQTALEDSSKQVSAEVALASAKVQIEEAELSKSDRVDASQSRKLLATFSSSAKRELKILQEHWKNYEARQKRRAILRIKDNLCEIDHIKNWRQVHKQTTAGTAEWFQTTTSFSMWRDYPGTETLSIIGDLGCGKSVLAANVVSYLSSSSTEGTLVAHFFCRDSTAASLKANAVIGSILGQMIGERLADLCLEDLDLLDAVTSRKQHVDNLDTITLHLDPSTEYYVVVDNLDYCENDQVEAILDAFNHLYEKGTFKIVLPTRSNMRPTILAKFPQSHIMHMRPPAIDADINLFVETALSEKLERGSLCLGDPALIGKICDYIVDGAESMFLWAYLMLEEISACRSDISIIAVLQKPPKKLSTIFEQMLRQACQNPEYDFMRDAFAWTLGAKRDLTIDELAQALSIRTGQSHLRASLASYVVTAAVSSTRGLITFDEDESTVRLVHRSFRHFLLRTETGAKPPDVHFQEADLEAELAELCLTFLNFDVFTLSLAKRPSPEQSKLFRTSVSEAAQTAIRTDESKTALAILKARQYLDRSTPRFSSPGHTQNASNLDRRLATMLSEMTERAHKTPLASEHPFLDYAKKFWYAHAAVLNPMRHKSAWAMFRTLFQSRQAHYDQPWRCATTVLPSHWLLWEEKFSDHEQISILYWSKQHLNLAITCVAMDGMLSTLPIPSKLTFLSFLSETLLQPPDRQIADAICSCDPPWYRTEFSASFPEIRSLLAVRFDMPQHILNASSNWTWTAGDLRRTHHIGLASGSESLFENTFDPALRMRILINSRRNGAVALDSSLYGLLGLLSSLEDFAHKPLRLLQLAIIYKSRSVYTLLIRAYDPALVANAVFMAILCEDIDCLKDLNVWMTQSQHWETIRLPASFAIMALWSRRTDIAALVANLPIQTSTEDERDILCGAILCAAEEECVDVYRPLLQHLQRYDVLRSFEVDKEMDRSLQKQFHNCKDRSVAQDMSRLWGEYDRQG